jgi:hypothetical protein
MKKLLSKKGQRLMRAAGIVLALATLAGCNLFTSTIQGSTAHVFAVGSGSGNVYEIDTDSADAATTSLVSTGQNSTGEMVTHGSKAFLAVGSYSNTAPGLYWFDLSSSTPSAELIGDRTSAQYLCIVSDTEGYVSAADWNGVYPNTVYSFNPSNPSAGLGSEVTGFDSGFSPQDIAYVSDDSGSGRVFVTDNANGEVYRLNAAGTAVDLTFSTSAGGTTGLLAGEYDGDNNGSDDVGVFVANTGGYGPAPDYASLPGSIDFIPLDATSGTDIVSVQSALSVGRLAAFDTTHLIATNYGGTWIIDLTKSAGDAERITEIKNSSSASFGSFDVNVYDGYAYVPDGTNTVYRISSSGDVSAAIDVGVSGEMISNVAARE